MFLPNTENQRKKDKTTLHPVALRSLYTMWQQAIGLATILFWLTQHNNIRYEVAQGPPVKVHLHNKGLANKWYRFIGGSLPNYQWSGTDTSCGQIQNSIIHKLGDKMNKNQPPLSPQSDNNRKSKIFRMSQILLCSLGIGKHCRRGKCNFDLIEYYSCSIVHS